MSRFNGLFVDNIGVLFCVCIVVLFVLFVLLIVSNIKLKKLRRLYGEFMKGKSAVSLENIVVEALGVSRQAVAESEKNRRLMAEHDVRIQHCVQGVGVIRYNAFEDMGGDLSFSVALLDQKSNGIAMTSITGRHDNRFYCKPIVAGKSVYPLSPEEENAIIKALGK